MALGVHPLKSNAGLVLLGFSAHCLVRRGPDLLYAWKRWELQPLRRVAPLSILDACGVWMFGSWWPSVASMVLTTLGICLLGLCCSRTSGNGSDPSLQLVETPAAQGYQDLKLVGLTGIRAVDGGLSTVSSGARHQPQAE